ncbi:MAG TPA: alpha/beta hydrolase [Xanthobacteraceae bacterium]|nr:alpha/beta hydrolase [Xanthobacteraceae bacterium]
MNVNYEAEYDNRARVPEFPVILARWQSESIAYREETTHAGRAELNVRYGKTDRQILDLFLPKAGAAAPLALFFHGGYWRALAPATFSQMARGLNARGVAVAVVGYDLCPEVSIADIVVQARQACIYLWRRFGRRVMVYGHSAGGHLAACLLATDWKKLSPDMPEDFLPTAYSISGLFDLKPMMHVAMNEDFRLDDKEATRVSPLTWTPPKGRVLDAVVGALESSEFLRQSREIADVWGRTGVTTRYEAIADANHFTVLDPLTDPNSAMVERLMKLVGQANSIKA